VLSRPLALKPKDAKPPAPGSPARGPVAWWKLDETTGANAADASGHHHPARIQGPAKWAPGNGQAGGAVELDGARSFLDCGDEAEFDFRDGLTVSLWVKPQARPAKGSQTLVAKGNDTWSLETTGKDGKLVFSLSGPQSTGKDRKKGPRVMSRTVSDSTRWHHVVGTYDGQRIALYVDGELTESVTAAGPVAVNTEPVWLGNNSAARAGHFAGALDDVRLFSCGLTEQEIKALYRGGGK
jgi:hypothetical protein